MQDLSTNLNNIILNKYENEKENSGVNINVINTSKIIVASPDSSVYSICDTKLSNSNLNIKHTMKISDELERSQQLSAEGNSEDGETSENAQTKQAPNYRKLSSNLKVFEFSKEKSFNNLSKISNNTINSNKQDYFDFDENDFGDEVEIKIIPAFNITKRDNSF